MTEYEKSRAELMLDPEFRVKYLFAKEKLDLELMIDDIENGIKNHKSELSLTRRVNKLRKHISALELS